MTQFGVIVRRMVAKLKRIFTGFLAIGLMMPLSATAENVYRWTDENGKVISTAGPLLTKDIDPETLDYDDYWNDEIKAKIKAKYYFGAPVTKATVKYKVLEPSVPFVKSYSLSLVIDCTEKRLTIVLPYFPSL